MSDSDSSHGEAPPPEEWPHRSVLFHEMLDVLALEKGLTVVDGTIGAAGHAVGIAEKIGTQGTIVGIDRDPHAIELAAMRLRGALPRVELVHGSYRDLRSILDRLGIAEVDRVLLDLGYSSMQIDDPGRGMSFRDSGPLDMRFDSTQGMTALDLLRRTDEAELARWFREYGEERHAGRIARALALARGQRCLPSSTKELADLVVRAVPPHARRARIHPETRVFQPLQSRWHREWDALLGRPV